MWVYVNVGTITFGIHDSSWTNNENQGWKNTLGDRFIGTDRV